MKVIFLLQSLTVFFVLCACNNKSPNIDKSELVAELKTEKPEKEITPQSDITENTEQDTIVTDMFVVGTTPVLKGTKDYLKQNNKYKDWDKNDSKKVFVGYVVERNGKASNVYVKISSENDELDKEAIRLVEEGEFTVGTDTNGKEIRTGNMMIVIDFPPL